MIEYLMGGVSVSVERNQEMSKKREFIRQYFQSKKRSSNELYPLSPGQEMLWRSHFMSAEQNHLNMFQAWKLPGGVKIEILKQSFQYLVDKYETLRTNYLTIKGTPYQYIHEKQQVYFVYEDLFHLNQKQFDEKLSSFAHEPFDIEKGPLFRIHVCRNHLNEHIMLINVHHLAIDVWSMTIIIRELGNIYSQLLSESPSIPQPVPDSYKPFVREQRLKMKEMEDERNPARTYWSHVMREGKGIRPINLPTVKNIPQSFKGETVFTKIDTKLCSGLSQLARDMETTVYNVLLTGLNILLYRYSGQENIWISTPFSRREKARYFNRVGYYVNTIHIHGLLRHEQTFEDVLGQISKKIKEAFEFQDISYSHFTQNKQESTNIIFSFQNVHDLKENKLGLLFLGVEGAKGYVGPLKMEVYPLKRKISQFEIELEVVECDSEMYMRLIYDPKKYDAFTMKKFCSHYVNLLSTITRNQHEYISEYQFLDETETIEQLQHFNHTALVCPNEKNTVLNLIEEIVQNKPNNIAVANGQESITYAELWKRANILATNLRTLGLGFENRIGLCMRKGIDLIIGILGVLKAGAVYVPLDPDYPAERIKYMISDSGTTLVILDRDHSALNDLEISRVTIQNLLVNKATLHGGDEIRPSQLAYMIYTSGSTGKPKGVMVSHGNLYASTYARRHSYREAQACHFLLLSPISFDSSLVGIFWTLCIGGKMVIPEGNDMLGIPELINEISNHQVTHLLSVPSLAHLLLSEAQPERIQSLQTIIVAGEQFPRNLLELQQEKYPKLTLYNEYGPTEGTVWASVHRVNETNYPIIPIGKPAKHCKLYILDESFNLVPKGVVGELYIAGAGVTRGYIYQPGKTAERYIPNPFGNGERLYRTGDLAKYNLDGTIQFIGRKDHQIKINGLRIELGEIEATYEGHPIVEKAVVVCKKEKRAQMLVAFIKSKVDLSQDELKEYGMKHLPHYLIPYHFVGVEEFPLSQNGKIDRQQLEQWKVDKVEHDPVLPRNKIESVFVHIFKQVLSAENIGVNDNFFEIGGDSIKAIQIASKASEKGLVLKPKDIFEGRTIARIAQHVLHSENKSYSVEGDVAGEVPLTPVQHWFFEQNFNTPNHWNQAIHLKVANHLSLTLLKEAINKTFEQHDSLKLRFTQKEGHWIQKYLSDQKGIQIIEFHSNQTQRIEYKISTYVQRLQKSLNVTEGPTVIVAMLENAQSSEDHDLIIIIHHLLVDIVSWQIILTDFERNIDHLLKKEKSSPQRKTTSFKRWSNHLIESINRVKSEKSYWTRVHEAIQQYDHKQSFTGSEGSTVRLECPLGLAETKALMQEVPKYFGTQLTEIVLSALALSLKKFTHQEGVVIDIEHHGRVPFHEEIDLSRTVGWFTNIYPLYFDLSNNVGPDADLLKKVKNTMREVPNSGLGYGILRYLQPDHAEDQFSFKTLRPPFSYNFLGNIDQTFIQSRYFTFSSYLSESARDPNEKRPYLIDFEPYITQENFVLRVGYSSDVFEEAQIQDLVEETIGNIKSLIQLCTTSDEIGYVSGDFPHANIGQKELEKFLSLLKNH